MTVSSSQVHHLSADLAEYELATSNRALITVSLREVNPGVALVEYVLAVTGTGWTRKMSLHAMRRISQPSPATAQRWHLLWTQWKGNNRASSMRLSGCCSAYYPVTAGAAVHGFGQHRDNSDVSVVCGLIK